MKKSFKTLFTVLLILILAMTLSSCKKQESGIGTLKVGVRGNVANFGLYDEDTDSYFGMDIDLAEMIAADLGYANVEYVRVFPETRESALEKGEVDCVIACYTITEERKKIVDFSPAYFTDKTVIMVEKSSLMQDVSSLKGAKIGYLKNTNSMDVVVKALPEGFKLQFVEYEDAEDMIAAMEYGKIDGVTEDRSMCLSYLTDERFIIPASFSDQPFGIATKKGSALSSKITDLVLKYKEDGKLQELSDKWQ